MKEVYNCSPKSGEILGGGAMPETPRQNDSGSCHAEGWKGLMNERICI